eukprot:gene18480-biopygen6919
MAVSAVPRGELPCCTPPDVETGGGLPAQEGGGNLQHRRIQKATTEMRYQAARGKQGKGGGGKDQPGERQTQRR